MNQPILTDWVSFNYEGHHAKFYRRRGKYLEVRESIITGNDQHEAIVKAEYIRSRRQFDIPAGLDLPSNVFVNHHVSIDRAELMGEVSYAVVVNATVLIKEWE